MVISSKIEPLGVNLISMARVAMVRFKYALVQQICGQSRASYLGTLKSSGVYNKYGKL
jgi:hypothetical protein